MKEKEQFAKISKTPLDTVYQEEPINEPQTHICNKDTVLLSYPAQYECSICGNLIK